MSRTHRGYVKHAALLIAAAFITLPAFAATDTVTNLNDAFPVGPAGSLRATIAAASSGDTIVFAPGLTGPIPLAETLTITQNLTISGPGASVIAVSGNNSFTVFVINAGVTAFISGLTIENAGGGAGDGGIFNRGTLTVTNCVISGNSSVGAGGIDNPGTLTVLNSTISGNTNTSTTFGVNAGGIYNRRGGNLTVTNSTISGNTAASGAIGGILNLGTLTVTNGTISGNSGPGGAGGIFNGGTATLKSTILANEPVISGRNCSGTATITSLGYNLSDDTSCSTSFTNTGDLNNTPAGLDPNGLQNNGGPTPTIALLFGSLAVDHIPPSACTDQSGNPVTVDQRYVMRPQGPGCDIGAFELLIPGAFQVRYVSHLDIGDSIINISNDGLYSSTYGGTSGINVGDGNLCVGVYVFDPNEELQSCCSCLVTPNGLASLSAQALNAGSLTGENATSLVVKLLSWSTTAGASSTAPPGTPAPPTSSTCNPGSPGPAGPTAGMHAWGTTVHALPSGGRSTYTVTETPFSIANLSPAEYAHITQFCQFNQINGSGTSGQCRGCASGGQ